MATPHIMTLKDRLAVNPGWIVCRTPATNSLTPTAQKQTRLPTSTSRLDPCTPTTRSTTIEITGKTNSNRTTDAMYIGPCYPPPPHHVHEIRDARLSPCRRRNFRTL